jgi:hypothetical protein
MLKHIDCTGERFLVHHGGERFDIDDRLRLVESVF